MKKIEISKFQDFIDSSYLNEGIQTNPSYWDKYFEKLPSPGSEESVNLLPEWAKTALQDDLLKGKTEDQRWEWLTKGIAEKIKGKQASKVEEIKGGPDGNLPGYRIFWKPDNVEVNTGYLEGSTYNRSYFSEMFKGSPGVYVDKKEEGGKPGKELGKGFWGQKKVTGATGAVGATGATSLGILWAEELPEPGSSTGSRTTLRDIFLDTDLGKNALEFVRSAPEYKEWEKNEKDYEEGKITRAEYDKKRKELKKSGNAAIGYTDSPPNSAEMNTSLSSSQKDQQKANAEAMAKSGQKVEEPKYKELTSGEYTYPEGSLNITWDSLFDALKKSGLEEKLNFDVVNVIGIRNTIVTKNTYSNRFTDLIVVMGPKKKKDVKAYPATTTPGPAYMYTPFRNWWISAGLQNTLNPNGVAILQPGVYDYKVGSYKGKYDALIQNGKVKIGRIPPSDTLKGTSFKTYSPSPIEQVDEGIDIIKAETNTPSIDSFSAGSQVFKKSEDFKEMMDRISDGGQDRVKYALIDYSALKGK